jgi:hypothetical protein
VSKKDALVPKLMKTKEDVSGIWSMYFDGSRNKNGSGSSVTLISPIQGTTSLLDSSLVVPIMWPNMSP